MLTFLDWAGGPVVGSHTNDAILQSAGAKSKYGEVEAHTINVDGKADCKFLGKNCKKKTKYFKRSENG
jgi:hypothetical protein